MEQKASLDRVIIKTLLTFDDFKKYSFYILYKNRSTLVMTIMGLFLIASGIYLLIIGIPFNELYLAFIIGFFAAGFLPVITLFSAKKNFSSNKELSEPITYEFEKDFIYSSSSFSQSKSPWENIFQIQTSKNWLIIYRSRQIVNLIPRRFVDQKEMDVIKRIVIAKNVKAKFRD